MKKTTVGLKSFTNFIIELISDEKTETLQTMETQMKEHSLIKYLSEKYPNHLGSAGFAMKDEVNDFFDNYIGVFDGVEDRKFGLKEKDGFLFLLAIILNDVL